MLSRYVIITSLLLVACGSGVPAQPSSSSSIESRSLEDDGGPDAAGVKCDAGAKDTGTSDALVDSSADAGVVEFDSGTARECHPTIGYCLTNQATRCYETSFDDSEACAQTGMSSGWHLGSCDPYRNDGEVRTSGGCLVGCQLTWSYPLGGVLPTDKSRADTKFMCEESGGTYVYPPTAKTALQ